MDFIKVLDLLDPILMVVKAVLPILQLLAPLLAAIILPLVPLLDEILEYGFDYILIDRTPFSTQNRDKIKLQIVPPNIYEASYPCHFFNQDYFERYFISKHYKLIEKFDALDGSGADYRFNGMILKKDNNV